MGSVTRLLAPVWLQVRMDREVQQRLTPRPGLLPVSPFDPAAACCLLRVLTRWLPSEEPVLGWRVGFF